MSRWGGLVVFSDIDLFPPMSLSPRQWMLNAPKWCVILGCGSLAVALARPRTPDQPTPIEQEGLAIMMVVDRSPSMEARDLVPDDLSADRLTVAKRVFREFVLGKDSKSGRPQDVIGLVSFAGFADSLCPLTADHANLAALVDELEIAGDDESGTAVGDALALAVSRLRTSSAKSKIAILLTDGVSNRGAIRPLQAAELAEEAGIKVYCIGVGTNGFAPVPAMDEYGRKGLMRVRVEIDEGTLTKVAERTGGRYFRATDEGTLAQIYETIDSLERSKVETERYLLYDEHYRPFLIAGTGLLSLGFLAATTFLRIEP